MNPKKAKEIQKQKREARKLKQNQNHCQNKIQNNSLGAFRQILDDVRKSFPELSYREAQKKASELFKNQNNG